MARESTPEIGCDWGKPRTNDEKGTSRTLWVQWSHDTNESMRPGSSFSGSCPTHVQTAISKSTKDPRKSREIHWRNEEIVRLGRSVSKLMDLPVWQK